MLIDSAKNPGHDVPAGFRHEAFVYTDDEDFLHRAAPYVRAGVDAGDVVLVAVPQQRIKLLREELGDHAEEVTFVDMTEAGRNPARIIGLWRDLLDENPGRPVRGLGEPMYVGRTQAEVEEARLYEALLNVAFEHAGPFRLRCPYEAAVASPEMRVAENHPVVLPTSDPARHEPLYETLYEQERPWAELAWNAFRAPLAAVPDHAERRMFSRADLTDLRLWATTQARSYGLSENRNDDLALALHEVSMNSIRFGGGRGTLAFWREEDRLICDVSDNGHIADLLIGRVPPPVTLEGGRGVWLANQLCDLVQIRSAPRSTQVRLHITLMP